MRSMKEAHQDKTPRLANWLLSRFVPDPLHEELIGDLKEVYDDRIASRGKVYAAVMYWVDTLHLLFGFTSFPSSNRQNSTIMIGHYLTGFLRNFSKHRVYSFMTIMSLVVGMGVCLTICQYIYFELSFDRFHKDYQ